MEVFAAYFAALALLGGLIRLGEALF